MSTIDQVLGHMPAAWNSSSRKNRNFLPISVLNACSWLSAPFHPSTELIEIRLVSLAKFILCQSYNITRCIIDLNIPTMCVWSVYRVGLQRIHILTMSLQVSKVVAPVNRGAMSNPCQRFWCRREAHCVIFLLGMSTPNIMFKIYIYTIARENRIQCVTKQNILLFCLK